MIQPQSIQQTRLHFHSQPMKESRSFYFVHILLHLFMSCTGWNRVRRALGECAPHFIQRGFFTQSNYALVNTTAIYRVWTEQVHHESCGEGKPVSDVYSSLRHGRNPLLVGRTGIFVHNGKLLCFLRSLGSGLRVYGNVVADPMHCLQAVASR